jgi:nitrile hydratase
MGETGRFTVGSRVRAAAVDPPHHTRVPRYVRGQVGVVVEAQGAWPLADDRARGITPPRVEPVYTVRFAADQLWGDASGHWVQVELWETYLEAAA